MLIRLLVPALLRSCTRAQLPKTQSSGDSKVSTTPTLPSHQPKEGSREKGRHLCCRWLCSGDSRAQSRQVPRRDEAFPCQWSRTVHSP